MTKFRLKAEDFLSRVTEDVLPDTKLRRRLVCVGSCFRGPS